MPFTILLFAILFSLESSYAVTTIEQQRRHGVYAGMISSSTFSSSSLLWPVIFAAGVAGLGSVDSSFADAGEEEHKLRADGMEKLVSGERHKLEELLKIRGLERGSYPPFSVSFRGPKVAIKFKVHPQCDVSRLIVDIVSHLGVKAEQRGGGSEMILHAWDSAAAWQLTLSSPEKVDRSEGEEIDKEIYKSEDDFCILIFEPLVGSEYCEIEFIKRGSFAFKELDALVSVLKLAGRRDIQKPLVKSPGGYQFKSDGNHRSRTSSSLEKSVSALEAMGVRVYGLDETLGLPLDGMMSWDNIAGYDQQKRSNGIQILMFEVVHVLTFQSLSWLSAFLKRFPVPCFGPHLWRKDLSFFSFHVLRDTLLAA